MKTVKKSIARFFGRLSTAFREFEQSLQSEQKETKQESTPAPELEENLQVIEKETPSEPIEESSQEAQILSPTKIGKNRKKSADKSRNKIIRELTEFVKDTRDIRDIMELMEVPIVSLSKNRTSPIIYERSGGKEKLKISAHREHYIASIYDWDIIIFVSSKLQETINSASDIPPRTLIVPRNELIKTICRHAGKTTDIEIEAALNRLQTTLIETTIHNEDYRYSSGFSFLDSWKYTERKDVKEFRITLSEWLYEITCTNGALLKVHPEYFKITSGFKRFLYRTARKHVGNQNESWVFSLENLHAKSGSEQELKKFKYKLKMAIKYNDIPGYSIDLKNENGKTLVRFKNMRKYAKKSLSSPANEVNP